MMETADGFKCKFPGLVTRMFDGEQKVRNETMVHIPLDAVRNFQNEDSLGDWKGFCSKGRGVVTSVEVLTQANMYRPELKKTSMDSEVWLQECGSAHLVVRTNHSILDQAGESKCLLDTIFKFEDESSRNGPDKHPQDTVPSDTFTCKFKVRWTDLDTSGKAGAAFMAGAAYDAVTAGFRAEALAGIFKATIRHQGVRYIKLDCFAEAEQRQLLELTVWTLEKKNNSKLLTLPGRKEEADDNDKVTAICLIKDAESGRLLCRSELQFQTEDTWIPWIKLTGEALKYNIPHP